VGALTGIVVVVRIGERGNIDRRCPSVREPIVHAALSEFERLRIVVHDSGRLYPEAIIFTTTAAEEGEK